MRIKEARASQMAWLEPDMAQTKQDVDQRLLKGLSALSIYAHKLRNSYLSQNNISDAAVFTALIEIDTAQHIVDEKIHKLRQAIENKEMFGN